MKILILTLGFFFNITFLLYAQEIINSGFEIPNYQSTTLSDSWESHTENAIIKFDSSVSYSGVYSMRIVSNEYEVAYFNQYLDIKVDSFQKYKMSAWIKHLPTVDYEAKFLVRIINNNSKREVYYMHKQPASELNDWYKYVCEFYLDGTHTEIQVRGVLIGIGEAWFDDFNIETLDDTSACSKLAYDYFNEALSIVEEYSIMKDSIDFPLIKEICLTNMNGLQSEVDCYPLIQYLLAKLGDNHSFFSTPTKAKAYNQNTDINETTGKIIENKFAYINLPSVSSSDSVSSAVFATETQNLIKTLDNLSPDGWIVDLRNNLGGNCWPMLTGIGPLIGDGVCCYLVDANDSSFVFSYGQGISYAEDYPICAISNEPYIIKNERPIAVLIGPNTASSGEITAISFIGKTNCKLFGEPTYGVTTGNSDFILSDSSSITLSASVQADRNFKKYGGKILPDFKVNFSDLSYNEDNDPVIEAAIKWIKDSKK